MSLKIAVCAYLEDNTTLGLRYDTPPELIEAFVQGVREIILAHPDTKDAYNVEFTAFGGSSLDIMVNMYFKTLAWGTVQNYKHQIHIAIIKLAMELGVDFAFPSTTMMIEQLPDKSIDIQYNTAKETTDKAIEKTVNEFKEIFRDRRLILSNNIKNSPTVKGEPYKTKESKENDIFKGY